MKRYLLKTLQDALLTWVVLEIGIAISSILYAILSVEGVSENTSLLVAFLSLVGLIILGLVLFSADSFALKQLLQRWTLKKQRSSKSIGQLESLVAQQNILIEKLTQNLVPDSASHFSFEQILSINQFTQHFAKYQQSLEQLIRIQFEGQEYLKEITEEGAIAQKEILTQIREQGHLITVQQQSLEQMMRSLVAQQQSLEQLTRIQLEEQEHLKKITEEGAIAQKEILTQTREEATLQRGIALQKPGVALTQVGQKEDAQRVWAEAERVISSIQDAWLQADALQKLGAALAQAGQWAEAERVIGSIQDARWQADALQKLGVALAQRGQKEDAQRVWAEAERVISSVQDAQWQAEALQKLGVALAQAGQWTEAERVIGSIQDA